TRCTALKASSLDRPTWKVPKVSRRSRGDPLRASLAAGAEGVRVGARRSGRSPEGSAGFGAALADEAHWVRGHCASGASGVEERTEIRIWPTGPTSAFSAEATWPE